MIHCNEYLLRIAEKYSVFIKATLHLFTGMSKLKLISATDTQYPLTLLESISEQRNNGLFCDVTIIVQDRKFKAHKTMLSASSTYLRHLFSVAGQVIELNFIKADIFEVILNYIYTAKLYRIRSDRLEDLINAGQILGVKFIANLAAPLSQVRGLPGLSKEGENSVSAAEKNESGTENMPIITESFSLSAEEFKMAGSTADRDESDDDVLFVSHIEAPKAKKTLPTHGVDANAEEGPEAKKQKVAHEEGVNTDQAEKCRRPPEGVAEGRPQDSPRPQQDTVVHTSPMMSPDLSRSIPASPLMPSVHSAPSTPARMNSFTPESHNSSLPLEVNEVLGVQKKKVLLEHSPDHPGKIKLSDVRPSLSSNNGPGVEVSPKVSAKKTITLDKASEIDSLSPGCKVYANIGENTYDIVPVKDDTGEGDARAGPGRKSQTPVQGASSVSSSTTPRSKKKAKMEQEDHYELIMDGKTFYVCIVCKRPYVCLTSLRRHFNTHSWERKYPCRYCSKVFALAEYRTKHEITHTGERRYQCLMCNEMFLNYQLLSTHCKQAHNQDPSGRKEKDDTDNNLYRLLPCKTLQFKPYSFVSEETGSIPVISEDGSVQHINPGKSHFSNQTVPGGESKRLNWEDIFVEPAGHPNPAARPIPPPRPLNQMNVENPTEFEFVIPETY